MIHHLALFVLQDKDGRMLLQHRDDSKENFPNQWGLFGGHIQDGESPDIAVCREAIEELGIKINSPKLFGYYEYLEFRMHIFTAPLEFSLEILRKQQTEGDRLELFNGDELDGLETTDFNKKVLKEIFAAYGQISNNADNNLKTGIIFRPAVAVDLDDILRLNNDLFKKEIVDYDHRLDLDWTYREGRELIAKAIIDKNALVEVVEFQGRVIGYSYGEIYGMGRYTWRKGQGAELINMYILPEFQKKGIGSEFCQRFGKWCKERGVGYIHAVAYTANPASEILAKKLGAQRAQTIYEKEI